MSSFPVRAADVGSQAASMDAAGSDDAFGYSGVDRDGVAGPRFVVTGEHVGRNREDHGGVGGGHHGACHRAHRTALHAAVVIGGGRGRIVRAVLGVHRVMIVFAVTGGLGMMARDVGAGRGARGHRRPLQPGALPPCRRAGDKRKRDGQNQDIVKYAPHSMMLTGPAGSRQNIFPVATVDTTAFTQPRAKAVERPRKLLY